MSPVSFKCKRSGNLISFTLPGDIEGLRKHEGYEEVKDVEATKTIETESQKKSKEVLNLRKAKASVPSFLQE